MDAKFSSEKTSLLKALRPLLQRHRWLVVGILVTGVLSALAEGIGISLFIPFLHSLDQASFQAEANNWLIEELGGLFNAVAPDQRLLVISACIFGSILIKAMLSYGHDALYSILSARVGHRLRSDVFDQLLSVSYSFLERSKSGDHLNTLSTETWRANEALSVLLGLAITISALLVYVTLLVLISWKMTLLVLAVMAAISGVVQLITRRVKAMGKQANQANAALADRMLEGFSGMNVIRAFSREPYEQERFDERSERVSNAFLKLGLVSGLVNPVYEILSAALLVSILYVSLQDPSNLPAVLVFIFVLYRLQPKVKSLDSARTRLDSLAASVEDVTSLLDRDDKPYISSGPIEHEGLSEAIAFDNVTFRYDPSDEPALRNVSARLPAGKTTALVGPSGAGKSTLIKLIFRFYDVTEGAIYVDGHPLQKLDLESWRSKIAFVSQEGYTFNTTVRDNIAYGKLDATDEEIVAAARKANAHEFITQFPDGYDTEVGDRGVRLSGGQRQRISLARAIVRDPDVLILDEATNSVDSISERQIQEALELLGRDRTVIVIAHRLSTVERADHIIVLDEGRVREQGPPQHLLKDGGLFAKLYNLQRHPLQHSISEA